jgi:DNA-binding NarL/FixJ family response regulator
LAAGWEHASAGRLQNRARVRDREQKTKRYRARILEKMEMKTNTDLIRYALQNKLID